MNIKNYYKPIVNVCLLLMYTTENKVGVNCKTYLNIQNHLSSYKVVLWHYDFDILKQYGFQVYFGFYLLIIVSI